jgi:hypothetical protein
VEITNTKDALSAWILSATAAVIVTKYDGTFLMADGSHYVLTGTYEID